MDRKAWIIIVLCSLGIVINAYYANHNARLQQEVAAEAAKKAAATAPATPGAPAAAGTSSTTPGPVATAGTAPAASEVPEESHTLTSGSVTWHFTNRGAGISHAVLAAGDQVTLNKAGKNKLEPIGALRREATSTDLIAYKIVEKTAKSVTFEGTSADGVVVRKKFALREEAPTDEHLVDLFITLKNTGANPHKSEEYYLYTGAAASLTPTEGLVPSVFWNNDGSPDHKTTAQFKTGFMGWGDALTEYRASYPRLRFAGVMSRFYATIVSRVSKEDKPGKVWAHRFLVDHSEDAFKDVEAAKNDYAMQAALSLPPVDLAAGAEMTEHYQIYAGPKEYKRLSDLGGQRDYIMFYGMFGWLSKPMNTLMRWMHDTSGNWGFAIILMTLCIRTLLWPLQSKAQRSMKRMGLLAPKMKELQERYKDDPQKQQAEVMKLYRDYGVNPVGGCFPMLLQIPIFFGFYSVLQNAAELRGQPFVGWVKDLSIPDTVHTLHLPFELPLFGANIDINPLPLIMGLTMILQMKLTPQPATMDKSQKIMFTIMPFFFLLICYNFAAALALYWSTQNLFAIFQSWAMKLYTKDPVLEKVDRSAKPAPQNPFFNPMNPNHKDKKQSKNRPPKLGG